MLCDITRRATNYEGELLGEYENYDLNGPFQSGELWAAPYQRPGHKFTLVDVSFNFTSDLSPTLVLIGYNKEENYRREHWTVRM